MVFDEGLPGKNYCWDEVKYGYYDGEGKARRVQPNGFAAGHAVNERWCEVKVLDRGRCSILGRFQDCLNNGEAKRR